MIAASGSVVAAGGSVVAGLVPATSLLVRSVTTLLSQADSYFHPSL